MVSDVMQGLNPNQDWARAQDDRNVGQQTAFPNRVGGGRLVRRYFIISALLIAGGLITSSGLEIYFRYLERREALALLQKETAAVAALKIERFIQDIETAMKAAGKGQGVVPGGLSPDYKYELKRLLFLAPAITEATAFDINGVVEARISRLSPASTNANRRNSSYADGFQQAKQGKHYFGPVYFFRQSEPYMTIALPIEHFKGKIIGVLQAEVNLKYVWETISQIKVGKAGHAFVVNRSGQLIAHRNISLVLRARNISQLQQVQEAFRPSTNGKEKNLIVVRNLRGRDVISAFAPIPRLDWAVFLERPAAEAYEALYASVFRTSSLLLLGLGMALLASLYVARRVLRPMAVLRHGVERISRGDLDHRVELKTGDEIESLAEEFNTMTSALQEAYGSLEKKVKERTQELASANLRLDEANRHKSQFLANMSHELRTPLNGILGLTEMVLDNIYGEVPEKVRSALVDVETSGRHLLSLINDVLDLSKIEAGQLSLAFDKYSMREVIQAASTAMQPLATAKHLALKIVMPGELPTGKGDQRRITQVVMNLVGNAIKFTESGEIRVEAWTADSSFLVSVSDSGPGIAPADQERIFEEFQQVDGSIASSKGGTGLGLAIAKRIIEMHGGRVWVDSETGHGATFTFRLPVSAEHRVEAR